MLTGSIIARWLLHSRKIVTVLTATVYKYYEKKNDMRQSMNLNSVSFFLSYFFFAWKFLVSETHGIITNLISIAVTDCT